MSINALMMDVTDNVVTCMSEIAKGETVYYRKGEELCTLSRTPATQAFAAAS